MGQSRIGRAVCAAGLTAAGLTAAGLTAAVLSGPAAMADTTPTGTLSVARACYVNTAAAAAKIIVKGAGWQAGEAIELTDKLGRISATATAGTDGRFTATVPAPVVDSYRALEVTDTIEAYYEGTPSLTAAPAGATVSSNAFLTTNYLVMQTGSLKDPESKAHFELSGFAPGRTVYAHYLTHAGALAHTVALGRASGPCGLSRVTTDAYPGGHPRKGTYTIQFDDAARFSRLTQPQYRFGLRILAS
jgi:hypothetical protein